VSGEAGAGVGAVVAADVSVPVAFASFFFFPLFPASGEKDGIDLEATTLAGMALTAPTAAPTAPPASTPAPILAPILAPIPTLAVVAAGPNGEDVLVCVPAEWKREGG